MISLNLKLVFLFALVAVVFGPVEAAPKKFENSKCATVCTANYDPVCAQDFSVKGSKPRTFGNLCTMRAHNCEHNAHMEVVSGGRCMNSGGVRLS